MKKILFFLPMIVLLLSSFKPKDNNKSAFYTSITKIDYVESTKVLKISTKINLEHIQTALNKKINDTDFKSELKKYYLKNFSINVNGVQKNISYSDSNPDNTIVWIYSEVHNISDISDITIKNGVLIDKFDEQQNFINFAVNGKKKSSVCNKASLSSTVNFN